MVRQDKNGRVRGRSVSPPALPGIIFPRSAEGTEHVSAQDPGPDIFERLGGKVIIDAAAAAGLIVHLVKYLSFLKPRMQLQAANAQRIFQILPRSRAKIHRAKPKMH